MQVNLPNALREQRKIQRPMTAVRACQVASDLLQRIDTNARTVFHFSEQERDAIQVLRDATAKLIVHGLRPKATP